MKVDVVYKLGSGSKLDNLELRYSLRSLSYFKDLGKVYIVGYKPDWLQNVIHIPCADLLTSNKDGNLINKLIFACHHPHLTEKFLNMSDDQLFLDYCTVEDFIVPFLDNSFLKKIGENTDRRLNRWETRLQNTIFTLQKENLPFDCFESHLPVLLDKINYTRILPHYDYVNLKGMCGNTLYFNSLKMKGRDVEKALRIHPAIKTTEEIDRESENKILMNYTEESVNEILLLFLQNKFPAVSIYENDF